MSFQNIGHTLLIFYVFITNETNKNAGNNLVYSNIFFRVQGV